MNLTLHSLEQRHVHPEIANSHLGDNIEFLINHLDADEIERLQEALRPLLDSRGMMDIGDKQFMVGHYVQAIDDFGPIAEGSFGIITMITPQLRGLFLLDGLHLMESGFAPSNVQVIFGTYIS